MKNVVGVIVVVLLAALVGLGLLYNKNQEKEKALADGEKKISEQKAEIDNLNGELDGVRKKAREEAEKSKALEKLGWICASRYSPRATPL